VSTLRRVLRKTSLLVVVFDLLFWMVIGLDWFRGIRKVHTLRNVETEPFSGAYPSLSVIAPACDEERGVGESVRSMLAQDYPGPLEVVAVDDRSTDRTGEILELLGREHPSLLSVLRVAELPAGWLGKNHALALGAAETRGDWLLFTDADAWFAPECFRKALDYATENGLDHLTLAPEILSRGALLGGFVAAFELIFVITQRPWRAKDPSAKEHVGVGAFNLVRREAYIAAGTHHAIRMRPDDDMKLAKLLKRQGRLGPCRVAPDRPGGGSRSEQEHLSWRGLPPGADSSRHLHAAPHQRVPVHRNLFDARRGESVLWAQRSPDSPYLRLPGERQRPPSGAPPRRAPPAEHEPLRLRHSARHVHHSG
jgi:hypothetical protein